MQRLRLFAICCALAWGARLMPAGISHATGGLPTGECVPRLMYIGAGDVSCYLPKHAHLAARQLPVPALDPVPPVTRAVHLPLNQVLVVRNRSGTVDLVIWIFAPPPASGIGFCGHPPEERAFWVGELFQQTPYDGPSLDASACGVTLSVTPPRHPHMLLQLTTNTSDTALLYQVAQRLGVPVAAQ